LPGRFTQLTQKVCAASSSHAQKPYVCTCSFLGWEDLDVVNPEDGKAEKASGSEQANEGFNQEVRMRRGS